MAKRTRLWRFVDAARIASAAHAAFQFLISQTAAVYVWGPLVTVWAFAAGWREQVQTPYLLAACSLTFGGILWCFSQFTNARWERSQKLAISFDRTVPSCRADVTFAGGSHSICFRLKVENTSKRKLHKCEGWLLSTDRFPNISALPIFWIGNPESYCRDLINEIPQFLQICRVDDRNVIHMATQGENWPIDSHGFTPGNYVFKIGIKGEDSAETSFCSVRLNWTGNWTTAEMDTVATDD
jgi:hypothetical protein